MSSALHRLIILVCLDKMELPIILALVSAVSSVFGGGLVAVFLRFKIQSRQADVVDFDKINAVLTKQRDEAYTYIKQQNERIENLEAEINGLRIARDLDPFPNWIVDLEGHYTFVNRPFEECFLEPQKRTYRDLIGKTHKDFWPPAFCETLRTLDASARKRPDGTARANTILSLPGIGEWEVTVHKFPCKIRGVVVAWTGYITVMDPLTERVGWQDRITSK